MTTTTVATTRRGGWTGPTRPYDLVKEITVAVLVVALLTTVLAALFSSPDEPAITLRSWAAAAPGDVVATATGELAGTTTSAGYGQPYNAHGDAQAIGPLHLASWAGVRIPVDSANELVVGPLSTQTANAPVRSALAQWAAATADQRTAWASSYADALGKAVDGNPDAVAAGAYGPVPVMAKGILEMARTGSLDAVLGGAPAFYTTDFTRPLLMLGDSGYLEQVAGTAHLQGSQWGMMNETGNYPGQAWLWLYTAWYQVPPFSTEGSYFAANADAIVWALMMVLSALLVAVPFIPGLRSVPLRVPVYRVIWRTWYRRRR
jgi:hypothetical protein